MKYLVLLIGEGELTPWNELSETEQQAGMQKFHDFAAACRARDGVQILAGEALAGPSSATTLRTKAVRSWSPRARTPRSSKGWAGST